MWVLAQGQPAWLGGHVGPGLMAQLLAMGVIGLGAAWAVLCARAPAAEAPPPSAGCGGETGGPAPGLSLSAPALLGAVLVFALSLPVLGLILAAGLSAGLAAWGAGGAHRARPGTDRRGADGAGGGGRRGAVAAHRPALARPLRARGWTWPPGPRASRSR